MMEQSSVAMQVRDLRVQVAESGAEILMGVSFELHAGKIFALVGESGSGKTITGQAILGLAAESGLAVSGTVSFDGVDLV